MRSWGGGIVVYRSYALYEEEKTYNVLKGTIPDFDYDVKLAVTIDDKESKTIPDRGLYKVNVTCKDASTTGEWDYNAWNVKLENASNGSKCKIAFTTNGLTQKEYQNYIDAGIALRRNTYRGKDITSYLENGELFTMIKNGTFDDIYVGDYMVSPTSKNSNNKDVNSKDVVWLVADIDNYMGLGENENNRITQHHVTIIPAAPLINAKMNDTADNASGYAGSKMVQTTLTEIYNKYIAPDFTSHEENHVITYSNYLIKSVESTSVNRFGNINNTDGAVSGTGASSGGAWYKRNLDLMSEVNAYGSIVGSSAIYDTGIDKMQYAIFQLNPKLVNGYLDTDGTFKSFTITYWLKDVVSSKSFSTAGATMAGNMTAEQERGVRPRFLIG